MLEGGIELLEADDEREVTATYPPRIPNCSRAERVANAPSIYFKDNT